MKRFVVTGCNGYIGSHMCYELKQHYPDCHILGIDMVEKEHISHLYDAFEHADLSRDVFYLSPFSNQPIDAIFHFAAFISVEEGERDPWKYYFNNVVGSLRLIKEAKTVRVPNFIFSSTAAVYGESTSKLFGHLSEDRPMNAFSVYGKTKQMVEEVLSNVSGMNVIRLRYFNACGRNVKANLYEEHDPETHLIPLLVKNKTAKIFGDDFPTKDGTCIRDYVHVIDICRAHIDAYRYMSENTDVNFAVNIGTGHGHSVKEVVEKVNQIIHNGEMEIEYLPRRDGDVPYLVADNGVARDVLGFGPIHTLDTIIKSMKE